MCGICGVFNFKNDKPLDPAVLKRMCDTLKHRGPDEEGYYTSGQIGLGIRRLSIIDLSTGSQPIHNEDKSIWVIDNGEIYNFQDLRKELENRGHKFYTKTDTETIVHLYEEYGERCVDHLRGMYAFAVWDEKNKKLFIARDRIGKKPLYYTVINGSLIFGSEIKPILEYLGYTPEIDLGSINLYLTYQYIPSPKTIWKGINRLLPASTLTCNNTGNIEIKKYWNLDFTQKTNLSFEEASEQIKQILTEATKIRMISDVPLGAFLSGGHDSTIIVGLMSQLSSKPVKTFSIGFKEETFSELKYASIVAKHFRTDHNEFIVEPKFIDILPKIIWHYDQPFADSSALPSYYVSNITRQHVTVALNGDGGDENFAGYLRYRAMKGSQYFSFPFQLIGKNATNKLASLIPHIETTKPKTIFRYMYRLFSALSENPARRNILWHCYFNNELKYFIYSNDMIKKLGDTDAYDYLSGIFENAPAKNTMDRTYYTDIMAYLPECLLVKMDIASMANSLETRSPFLDQKLMEFTASLPTNWKLKGLNFSTKHILKHTFRDLIPKEILHRGKMGFGIPIGKWFRYELKDYIRETLLSNKAINRGYFKRESLEQLLKEHAEGYRDHGYRLWALLVLELWHTVFVDKKP